MGRPTDYTEELADKICNAISTSPLGLTQICEDNHDFPVRSVVFAWMIKHPKFADKYAIAKRQQAELMADEIISIAYDNTDDILTDRHGSPISNTANINRARLKIDTLKWIACKLLPKVYGDKTESNHTVVVDEVTNKAKENLSSYERKF